MSNLKALPWERIDTEKLSAIYCEKTQSYIKGAVSFCSTPVAEYVIRKDEETGKYVANYGGRNENTYDTIDEAEHWAEHTHYASKMQPYVNADSITDIANWFKAAKPEPSFNDYITQLGCHFEEVCEMMAAIGGSDETLYEDLCVQAESIKGMKIPDEYIDIQKGFIDELELLDALCDQIVTATGVAYMMGFDIEGALKEVIRSNNSKMIKGKFQYDENGKIAKPESYSKPDLTPFLKQGE